MAVKLKYIIEELEKFAPLPLQEEYDNSGLQTGSPEQEINSVIVSLDVTDEIIDEAITKKCNLIISHHPVIFSTLKKISPDSLTGNIIIKAIKNDIAIYSMHTNLDNSIKGINQAVAEKLGLTGLAPLIPKKGVLKKIVTYCPADYAEKVREALFAEGTGYIGNYDKCSFNITGTGTFRALEGATPFSGNINETFYGEEVRIETIFPSFLEKKILKALFKNHPYEEVAYDIFPLENEWNKAGTGIVGVLEKSAGVKDFLINVKEKLSLKNIRYNSTNEKQISKIAVCTGAGGSFLKNAIIAGADAYITSDIKYHSFQEAQGRILLIDCGHFETEIFAKEIIRDVLTKKIANFAVLVSEKEQNPVKYF